MRSYINSILGKKRLTKNYGLPVLNVEPEGHRDQSPLGVIYWLPEVLITGRLNEESNTCGVTSLTSRNGPRCQVGKPQSPECMSSACLLQPQHPHHLKVIPHPESSQPQPRRGGRVLSTGRQLRMRRQRRMKRLSRRSTLCREGYSCLQPAFLYCIMQERYGLCI